jgi:hypothetical protein
LLRALKPKFKVHSCALTASMPRSVSLTSVCTSCDNSCATPHQYKTELERERKALATKIAKRQTRVAALAALCEESEELDKMTEMELGGLTNACRTAFRAAGNRGLMPTDVRAALERLRFPIRTHKNILASIHTVIRRLEQGGEIRKAIHDIHNGSDKSVYLWAGPNYGASNSLANQMADADRDRLRRKS